MTESFSILAAKIKKGFAQLPHMPRALSLVWSAARYWTLAWAVLLVLQGLLPVAAAYLIRLFVDHLAVALRTQLWDLGVTLFLAALLMSILLLIELLRSLSNWVRTAQSELVKDYVVALVHEKSVSVDLTFYDLPEYYDQLHRVRVDSTYRPVTLLENFGGLVQNSITLLGLAILISIYGIWLPVALMVSTIPAFYVVIQYALRQYQWRLKMTQDERKSWYYDWLLTDKETATEVRLFDLGAHFQTAYQSLRGRLRGKLLALVRNQTWAEAAASILAFAITGSVMTWMLWQFIQSQASLGDLALFYQVFSQAQNLVRALLGNIAQIYSDSLFLGNLFEFLELKSQISDPVQPVAVSKVVQHGISFNQVSFQYPGTQRFALQSLDLAIPAGQIVAIIGPNGAGKSTLIKLLCRLYDPSAGRIEIDGTDLRHMKVKDLRQIMAVLPQDYARYNATVAESIALGDWSRSSSSNRIQAAARAAKADEFIEHLPNRYENLLGRWFEGGAELSVGEWQRIALARAWMRDCPILILDEPTSSMDPWTETEWLTQLRELVKGRITIIITHRVTTAMSCDVIFVMQDGRVIESGNHQQLLMSQGRYAQLWSGQP